MRKAKEIRQECGFSPVEIARSTSIEQSHLYRFEHGQVEFSISKLQELARLYSEKAGRRVTIDELVQEAEPAQAGA